MLRQHAQRHDVERALMCGGKIDLRGAAFVMGLEKAGGAQAPVIPRLQPGKVELGPGGGQIVADIFGKGEKFGRHHGADGVAALIFGAGVAMSVAEEPGDGIAGAGGEIGAQNVEAGVFVDHGRMFAWLRRRAKRQ